MIVLASTSVARQSMLHNAGLAFTIARPDVDERALVIDNPQWPPRETALKLAEAKAMDVSCHHAGVFVIGADQVLSHSLISAVVLVRSGKTVWSHVAESRLTMRDYSDEFLETYLDAIGDDCVTSVGGYKIEGPGVQLFSTVSGDHFTILGLPLLPLLEKLREVGEITS